MLRKFVLASTLTIGAITAGLSPAQAGGWSYTGPHGNTATFNHWGGGYWGPRPCCYGGAAVAGLAVGTAVGVAAATARPVYAPPSVVYVPPPPVIYAPPPVVYTPRGYYYVP